MAEEFRLTRTGDVPLVFYGRRRAARVGAVGDAPRWTDVALYQTERGQLVAELIYRTKWKGEHDRHTAMVCRDEAALVEELRTYDPVPPGIGFPPGAQFVAKQQRLEAALRHDYAERVTSVLEGIGAEERIE